MAHQAGCAVELLADRSGNPDFTDSIGPTQSLTVKLQTGINPSLWRLLLGSIDGFEVRTGY
jgi:hypothetical protein